MRHVIYFALALATAACAGSARGSRAPASGDAGAAAVRSTSQRASRGGPNLITAEEIAESEFRTALEIVERLRPTMLRNRGPVSLRDQSGSASTPLVYVDNVQFGTLEALKSIPAMQVREIRYITPPDATTRWGTGHPGGVILVLTRDGTRR